MAALPKTIAFQIAGTRFRVIHGGVDVTNRFVFASERKTIAEELARTDADVVIAGHCGIPFARNIGQRVWFNPGVIGMPANDGTPEVWYGLVHVEQGELVLSTHRLAYDHIGAAAALRRSGHADGYARTLITGLWPSLDILPAAERAATGRRITPRTLRVRLRAPAAAAE